MPTPQVPTYVLSNLRLLNTRAFKALKRRQLRRVIQVVDDLRLGCAYMPGSQHIEVIAQLLVYRRSNATMDVGKEEQGE